MKFLLDENVDYRLVSFLTELGHNVKAIAHDYPFGLKDSEVLSIATREKRVLITNDRDYGELIFRLQHNHCGVIYFRLKRGDVSLETKKEKLLLVLATYPHQIPYFLVVTQTSLRIRHTNEKQAA